MRYVRKQIVTRVLADETVNEIPVIKDLFKTLFKARTDISISYRTENTETLTSHSRVRFVLLSEDTFDITVINPSHSMTVKKIPYSSVEYVCATVVPSEVFTKKETVEKGDILDLS